MATAKVAGPQPKASEIETIKEIECEQGAIRAVRFNVDGAYCLTAGSDKTVKLWNPYRPILLKTYLGHGQEVLDTHSNCDSSQLLSCGLDRNVLLWDVSTGQTLRRWRYHAAAVTAVRFLQNGNAAVSGGQDNAVNVWDVRSRSMRPIQELKEATDTITSVRAYEYELVTASVDCRVRRYDVRAGEIIVDFIGSAVTCASFTNDSQGILVSSADNFVRLIDKDSGSLLSEYSGHSCKDCILESCVDASDSKVISGSACGNVWMWDLLEIEGKSPLKLSHSDSHGVSSVVAHPTKSSTLLSAGGRTIKLWADPEQLED